MQMSSGLGVNEYAFLLCGIVLGTIGTLVMWYRYGRWQQHRISIAAARRERSRIARELHDEVGHGLVVIALHARNLAHTEPQRRDAYDTIDRAAQSTLRQMRRTIRELGKSDPIEPLSTELRRIIDLFPPQVHTRLEIIGNEPTLTEHVHHLICRVVREGLSNAIRHSGGEALIEVNFTVGIEVTVRTPPGSSQRTGAPFGGRGGTGIHGLRVDVGAVGGSLEDGPLPDGGFRLHARLDAPARGPVEACESVR